MAIAPDRMIPIPEPPPGGFTIRDLDDLDDLGHHRGTLSIPVPWPLTVDLTRLYP